MFLMMIRVFDGLGYRRYEWKCDALNSRSIKAAERLGFKFEGIFRQATMYKNRNRDTTWFSIIDKDWPQLKKSFQLWLNPENFDQDGQQKLSLTEIRNNQ
jgi:RimJ/RimL family protein N-acetyltransferase